MEFNFDNINCGPSSASGSGSHGVVAASTILSLPSYSLLSQELLHLQQQSAAQQQQIPQLIFSTPSQQQQQSLQQQQDQLQLQMQPSPLISIQVQDQQLQSQMSNFAEYVIPDFMNGENSANDHNHDDLPDDESISLLLMPPQSPTVIKTELDKIEETIKEVGSGTYFQDQDQEVSVSQQQRQQCQTTLLLQSQPKIEENGGLQQMQNSLQISSINGSANNMSLVNSSESGSYPNNSLQQPVVLAPASASQVQEHAVTNSIKSEPGISTSTSTKNCTNTSTTTTTASTNGSSAPAIPNSNHIGSRNSAFMPYKPITVLTNLQRGNVKTLNKEITLQKLTLHEKAARGDLTLEDLNGLGNIDTVDTKGRTMLHWAAFHSKLQSVQMLVDKSADVNFCTPKGETPLMYASANGHVEIINYLLTKAASLDLEDENGNTPIFYATIANHAPSISALLRSGASLTKTNCNGDSPFNIAISRNLTAAQYAMESYLRDFLDANYVIKSEKLQSN